MSRMVVTLRRVAPFWMKKFLWNFEFRSGKWAYLHPPDNLVRFLLQMMGTNGSLLDLGCGTGVLAASLRSQGWDGPYTGVDVSSQALHLASQRDLPTCQWVLSDLRDFSSHVQYDAIVLIESIYYMALEESERLLRRLTTLVTPQGSIVVRIHDPNTHSAYLCLIERVYPTAKKFFSGTGQVYYVLTNNCFSGSPI